VIVVPGGAGARLAAVGSRLERTLWWWGAQGYEPAEARWWRRLCADAANVLEIGANIGWYSVVGGTVAPEYTAVEPNPEAAAVLRRNLDLNGLQRVRLVEAAVVGDGGPPEVELALPDQEAHSTAPTGSFLTVGTEAVADRHARRRVTVPTVAAAALFAGRDLVKLDIEGSEATVLTAALPEIRRSRPILLVEWLGGATRLHQVLRELGGARYRVFELAEPLRALDLSAGARPGSRDVLVVPEERLDQL
jgi:FkbM family methyltransferase